MARTSPVSGPTRRSQLSRKLMTAPVSGGGGRMRLARPSRTQGILMHSGANLDGKGALPGRQEWTIRQFLRNSSGAGESREVPWTHTAPPSEVRMVTLPPPNGKDRLNPSGSPRSSTDGGGGRTLGWIPFPLLTQSAM